MVEEFDIWFVSVNGAAAISSTATSPAGNSKKTTGEMPHGAHQVLATDFSRTAGSKRSLALPRMLGDEGVNAPAQPADPNVDLEACPSGLQATS